MKKVIYLAGDHAGFYLKQKVKAWLKKQKYKIVDCGPLVYHEDDDYPDFVIPLAEKVAKGRDSKGIIIAGSGQGEAIAANRIRGARAAFYYGGNPKILKLSREHNDANILSLGARFLNEKQTKNAIKLWLKTPFSNVERHKRRLRKIDSKR